MVKNNKQPDRIYEKKISSVFCLLKIVDYSIDEAKALENYSIMVHLQQAREELVNAISTIIIDGENNR